MRKGITKRHLIILTVSLIILLLGMGLLMCELFNIFDPILVFGKINLGLLLVLIGGGINFFLPKAAR